MRVKLGASAWYVTAILLTYLAITTVITTPWSKKSTSVLSLTPMAFIKQGSTANENFQETTQAHYVEDEHNTVTADIRNVTLQSVTIGRRNVTTHVAFLKVHKTASSTVQNVFLRFGDSRNLTFILAHTHGEAKFLNVISYTNSITDTNVVPPPLNHHYDLLCCHVIYDRKSFESVLPSDTAYVGIVREPISRFKAAMNYFSPKYILKIEGNHPVSQYVDDPMKYEPSDPRRSWINNRMAVEFGFPLQLFPGNNNAESKVAIHRYLENVGREFDFIIVSEFFDESVVLMRRLLGWTLKDVLYMKQNSRSYSNSRKSVQDSDIPKLKRFLALDQAVYQFALNRFDQLKQREGKDFIKEVNFFKNILKRVDAFCHQFQNDRKTLRIEESSWNTMFEVTRDDCKKYTMDERAFIQKQRMRMYGTLDN